jgi:hypothetical protein
MKTIPLTRGKVAIVNNADFKWLAKKKWRAIRPTPTGIERWYAVRTEGSRGQTLYMHKAIVARMGLPPQKLCDHRDGDGLNNRRSNLRPCSPAQNVQNKRKQTGLSSRFKGVYWHKRDQKWMARLGHNGTTRFLGYFENEKDAAKAYDQSAIKTFGPFAKVNLP